MNFRTIKGQVLILVCLVFFAAAVVLFLTNIKNECAVWCGKNLEASTGMVMLISALFGAVAIFVVKLLVRGVKDLKIGRLQARLQRVDRIEKTQPQASKPEPKE